MERTLSIIKPDAVAKNVVGKILDRFESAGLRIAATKKLQLSKADAEAFYAVHAARPFFKDLVEFMISGPVVVSVLEGVNAMAKNRDLMGATNPKEAAAGTIRADFADSIDANAVHILSNLFQYFLLNLLQFLLTMMKFYKKYLQF